MLPRTGPIFIIATPGDVHALAVAARIEARSEEVMIWDSGRLPARDHLTLHLTRSGQRKVILDSTACGTVDLSQFRSIWWRRPIAPTIPSNVDDAYIRAYCRSETDQLFRGALAGLDVPIYNDPDFEDKATRKPYHLSVAYNVGLRVPVSLMTCSAKGGGVLRRARPSHFQAFSRAARQSRFNDGIR